MAEFFERDDEEMTEQIQQVCSELDVNPSTSQGRRLTTRDETILNEDTFNRLFDEFKEFVKEKEKKRARLSNFFPTVKNEHGTCQGCFEDIVKLEESEFCADGNHQFCRTCVRKLVERAVAQNVRVLNCMVADCPSTFSDETAKRVLKPIIYERWTFRCQLEEMAIPRPSPAEPEDWMTKNLVKNIKRFLSKLDKEED